MSKENARSPQPDVEGAEAQVAQSEDPVSQDEVSATELSALRTRIEQLEAKLAEARENILRAVADSQNVRRRASQEILQARVTAAAEIAAKLLPVLDNFERTLAAADAGASLESVLEGVSLIDRQIREVLEQHNVRPIESLGTAFDPTLHEAVLDEYSDHSEGTVIGELERGYLIGDRVLRPAKVKISKGTAG
ncbi:MAG: nucleotide exchange factor GrpE [Fimbriimonadales bacterium]|nr:nucleotide exchange factor GrpE [Fimbriimonadales bacterium]